MTKKNNNDIPEISPKSTKDQIFAAYSEVLSKLAEKQVESPQVQKKQQEEKAIVTAAFGHSSDEILTDLSTLKSKTIKQIDGLSEQLLGEFQKLANLRQAIALEQKHLQELYQINETANTLSALLQTQTEQKEQFSLEMAQTRQNFETEMISQKSYWQQQLDQLELDYKEQKEKIDKSRKREEEEYKYTLEQARRKETDEYNNTRLESEKELLELKGSLLKQEADLAEKAKNYDALKIQVEQIADQIKEAVAKAEDNIRASMLQQHGFESELKQREYDGTLKLKEQSIAYLEEKIKKQDILIKELTERSNMATEQIQLIACRALDTSAGRFVPANITRDGREDGA